MVTIREGVGNSLVEQFPGAQSPADLWSPLAGDWHVLHTKSRQEKMLAGELAAMGIHCFLPLVHTPRIYGSRKAAVELPLFPGYLFLRGSVDDVYMSDRTHRVSNIIWVRDQRTIDWELTNLFKALSSNTPLDSNPALRNGVRAEVRSGPLRGIQGVVQDRIKADRLVLQINILGRAVAVELNGAILEPV